MAMYVTPLHRMRRQMWQRSYPAEQLAEAEFDVFVPVNVKAGNDEFIITALLPGVNADDLSIQVVNETVTLQGDIKGTADEAAKTEENYLLRECPTGRFFRMIRLSEPLDSGKAAADLTNGVLTLRVPKAEEARPRTIKVNSN